MNLQSPGEDVEEEMSHVMREMVRPDTPEEEDQSLDRLLTPTLTELDQRLIIMAKFLRGITGESRG